MGVALFAVRRWRLPLGTFSLLYLLNSTLAITQSTLSLILAVAVFSLLTGLLVDLLYQALKPTVERREALRLFAFLAPVVIQTIYFLALLAPIVLAFSLPLCFRSFVL